ncbi:MAG: hypothetical protein J0I34_21230 [Pseudonocardia sp.]|uniref:hypothetical protein n=1 Tax=unclassified Pseudonocardia TaxID=2619320 RepID=UPI0008699A69|nr:MULTISPECIES: hypothetical protein [unclassified Pseudonocardia]MBN9111295.1 hypothetical protein [Pseudonocardia sp.]ODU24551.1 MAG: hypothetical protein ABS80_12130 [Pseudonocardia sp. SCN 72-51]ODV06264.1 MAG: hypothetical protein ABT15_13410 [Pseudonocardia sp. SCN 73-27]
MSIAWGSLGIVSLVSLAAGVAVVVLLSVALVGLSARAKQPVGGPHDGAEPGLSPAAGTAIAAVCLLAAAAIVGYGLYLIIA